MMKYGGKLDIILLGCWVGQRERISVDLDVNIRPFLSLSAFGFTIVILNCCIFSMKFIISHTMNRATAVHPHLKSNYSKKCFTLLPCTQSVLVP